MQYNLNNADVKQHINAAKLIVKAAKLGMEIGGYSEIGYNNSYGNTYLWLEDYQFTLLINDHDNVIKALYTCSYDGEETFRNVGNSLDALEKWCNRLYKKSEKKE